MILGERELAGGEAYDLAALLHGVDAAHGAAACRCGGAQVICQVGARRVRPVALALHTHARKLAGASGRLKGLSDESDLKNVDKNLQNLA